MAASTACLFGAIIFVCRTHYIIHSFYSIGLQNTQRDVPSSVVRKVADIKRFWKMNSVKYKCLFFILFVKLQLEFEENTLSFLICWESKHHIYQIKEKNAMLSTLNLQSCSLHKNVIFDYEIINKLRIMFNVTFYMLLRILWWF